MRQICPHTLGIAMMFTTILRSPNNCAMKRFDLYIKILYQNFEESGKCMKDPGSKFFNGFQKSTHKN